MNNHDSFPWEFSFFMSVGPKKFHIVMFISVGFYQNLVQFTNF